MEILKKADYAIQILHENIIILAGAGSIYVVSLTSCCTKIKLPVIWDVRRTASL